MGALMIETSARDARQVPLNGPSLPISFVIDCPPSAVQYFTFVKTALKVRLLRYVNE